MNQYSVTDTGFGQQHQGHINRIPAYDPVRADHFWTVNTVYRWVDNDTGQTLLDLENCVMLAGPGCWYCEQNWTEQISKQPCSGDPID